MSEQPSVVGDNELFSILEELAQSLSREYRRVLVITPDATRSCPLTRIIPGLQKAFLQHGIHADYLIALGTHRYLSEDEILDLYGIRGNSDFADSRIDNHEWKSQDTFRSFGVIEPDEEHFNGRMDILLNRKILDYDVLLPVSPVFPHEIAGFSGGPKYFFPGISGGDFLQKLHWQAVCTGRWNLMGKIDTATRRIIDEAAQMIPRPVCYLTMAVDMEKKLRQISWGEYRQTWEQTVEASRKIHIRHTGRQYKRVIALAPVMYWELWTAAKAMYKLDQIVESGGELVLYGPHIQTFSFMWDRYVDEMGFHTLDYLLENQEKFSSIPEGVLSFSTNARGPRKEGGGLDEPRISLVLATSIPEERCRNVNLGYANHEDIDPGSYKDDPDTLVVDHAGEILYLI